jgi:hypothetical protein
MSTQTILIPPTGRITIALDWAADLDVPPRCDATLSSAAWTLPTGITQVSASVSGTKAILTITTANLKINAAYTAICAATLSNSDILTAAVVCTASHRSTKRSSEVCPP